jgi:hypothetical protein
MEVSAVNMSNLLSLKACDYPRLIIRCLCLLITTNLLVKSASPTIDSPILNQAESVIISAGYLLDLLSELIDLLKPGQVHAAQIGDAKLSMQLGATY